MDTLVKHKESEENLIMPGETIIRRLQISNFVILLGVDALSLISRASSAAISCLPDVYSTINNTAYNVATTNYATNLCWTGIDSNFSANRDDTDCSSLLIGGYFNPSCAISSPANITRNSILLSSIVALFIGLTLFIPNMLYDRLMQSLDNYREFLNRVLSEQEKKKTSKNEKKNDASSEDTGETDADMFSHPHFEFLRCRILNIHWWLKRATIFLSILELVSFILLWVFYELRLDNVELPDEEFYCDVHSTRSSDADLERRYICAADKPFFSTSLFAASSLTVHVILYFVAIFAFHLPRILVVQAGIRDKKSMRAVEVWLQQYQEPFYDSNYLPNDNVVNELYRLRDKLKRSCLLRLNYLKPRVRVRETMRSMVMTGRYSCFSKEKNVEEMHGQYVRFTVLSRCHSLRMDDECACICDLWQAYAIHEDIHGKKFAQAIDSAYEFIEDSLSRLSSGLFLHYIRTLVFDASPSKPKECENDTNDVENIHKIVFSSEVVNAMRKFLRRRNETTQANAGSSSERAVLDPAEVIWNVVSLLHQDPRKTFDPLTTSHAYWANRCMRFDLEDDSDLQPYVKSIFKLLWEFPEPIKGTYELRFSPQQVCRAGVLVEWMRPCSRYTRRVRQDHWEDQNRLNREHVETLLQVSKKCEKAFVLDQSLKPSQLVIRAVYELCDADCEAMNSLTGVLKKYLKFEYDFVSADQNQQEDRETPVEVWMHLYLFCLLYDDFKNATEANECEEAVRYCIGKLPKDKKKDILIKFNEDYWIGDKKDERKEYYLQKIIEQTVNNIESPPQPQRTSPRRSTSVNQGRRGHESP